MKVLELYRLLPRTNCGRCPAKQCLAFAVALAKGEAAAQECPDLTEETRRALDAGGGRGDWREALLVDLRREVAGLDLAGIAAGLGAESRAGSLSIRCLGRDFLVAPDGTVASAAPLTPWMQILLLHYVRTAGSAPLSGRWVSFAALKSGLVKATSFARECEEPLRELFDRAPEQAQRGIARLGGVRQEGTPAPVAWRVPALPQVPVLVLYWPEEDEFPSKLKVLFDATADRYLDVESLTFLIEGLARTVAAGADRPPHH